MAKHLFMAGDAINVLNSVFGECDQDDIFWSDTLHRTIRRYCEHKKIEWPGEGVQIAMIEAGRFWFQGIPAPYGGRELFCKTDVANREHVM